jgi:hypothetical protein
MCIQGLGHFSPLPPPPHDGLKEPALKESKEVFLKVEGKGPILWSKFSSSGSL